jgi:hypothetical protein
MTTFFDIAMIAGHHNQRLVQICCRQQPCQHSVKALQPLHGPRMVLCVAQHVGLPPLKKNKIVGLTQLPKHLARFPRRVHRHVGIPQFVSPPFPRKISRKRSPST